MNEIDVVWGGGVNVCMWVEEQTEKGREREREREREGERERGREGERERGRERERESGVMGGLYIIDKWRLSVVVSVALDERGV
jgi:hypothetical protein